jgi:hypothetical protein
MPGATPKIVVGSTLVIKVCRGQNGSGTRTADIVESPASRRFSVERVTGIELALSAWEAVVDSCHTPLTWDDVPRRGLAWAIRGLSRGQ